MEFIKKFVDAMWTYTAHYVHIRKLGSLEVIEFEFRIKSQRVNVVATHIDNEGLGTSLHIVSKSFTQPFHNAASIFEILQILN